MSAPTCAQSAPCPLTAIQIRQIAGVSLCDPRTVRTWARGKLVKWSSASRLADACAKLGIPIPPGAQLTPEPVTAP